MKTFVRIISVFVVILAVVNAFTIYSAIHNDENKVKMSIFYETYCPYSIKFLVKQLYPIHKLLGDYIELDLVPYGKATQMRSNGIWQFSCQHGKEECFGNKVHACANNYIDENSTNNTLEFIVCSMNTYYSDEELSKCAAKAQIDWAPLKSCIHTQKGNEILAELGDRTHNTQPHVKFVPMVFFNGAFDRKVDDHAMEDLLDTVCRFLKKPRPQVCIEHEDKFLERLLNFL